MLERERLRQLSLHALEALGGRLLDAGRFGEALEAALDAVAMEPLYVHADRTRLAQVIGKLLSNALKFSDRGQTVRVRVDLDACGGSVVLTVDGKAYDYFSLEAAL